MQFDLFITIFLTLNQFYNERKHFPLEDFIVEVVISVEELEVFAPVVLNKLWLAIDSAVVVSEESVDEFSFSRSNPFEAMLLYFPELCDHLLVDLEVLGTILPWIAEGFASHAHEGEQACHVERRIDENTKLAAELFCVHGSHGGGHDELGLDFCYLLPEEGQCLGRHHRDVRRQYLDAPGIERIAHAGGGSCGTAAGKTVDV